MNRLPRCSARSRAHKADKLPPRYLYKDAAAAAAVRERERAFVRRSRYTHTHARARRSKHSGHWHPGRSDAAALDRRRTVASVVLRSLAFSIRSCLLRKPGSWVCVSVTGRGGEKNPEGTTSRVVLREFRVSPNFYSVYALSALGNEKCKV